MLMLGLFLVSMIPVAVFAEAQTAAELRVAREEQKQKVADFKLQFRENRDEFKAKRLELRDRRTSYSECKATKGEESADCEAIKDDLKDSSRDFMRGSLDMVIPWVESAIANLGSIELESRTSQKEQAIADLEADLTELKDLKVQLDGWSTEDISDESVKEHGSEIAMSIRSARLDVKYALGLVIRERFDRLFARLGDATYPALDAIYAELQAACVDVTEIGDNIAQMKANAELAEQAYNAALPLYDQARSMAVPAATREEARAAFDQAKEGFDKYKEAKDYLKESRENLRTAVRLIKETSGGQEILERNVEAYLL